MAILFLDEIGELGCERQAYFSAPPRKSASSPSAPTAKSPPTSSSIAGTNRDPADDNVPATKSSCTSPGPSLLPALDAPTSASLVRTRPPPARKRGQHSAGDHQRPWNLASAMGIGRSRFPPSPQRCRHPHGHPRPRRCIFPATVLNAEMQRLRRSPHHRPRLVMPSTPSSARPAPASAYFDHSLACVVTHHAAFRSGKSQPCTL